jgi:thiaminase/transcriptional activator TenA
MGLTCQQLLETHADEWHAATHHPFLDGCKAGTIKPEQFNTWLVQDYHFVTDFVRMTGRLLASAPVHHFDNLLGGLMALKDELNWFREKAAERDLNLGAPRQKTCELYCEFMQGLAHDSYAVQATAFWAIELAYNQGWQIPGLMVKPYDEFADRWGNPGFTAYVGELEKQADETLENSIAEDLKKAEAAFLKVAELENLFWEMAFQG